MCFLRDMVVEEMSCEGDGGGGRGRTKGHWVQTSRQFILKNIQNHMTSLLHVITTIAYLFFNLF